MDRALFRDEPLTGFITICCFLVFNFEFYFLQRYCRKVASLCAIGATLLQCAKGCWQPSGKFFTAGKRVWATPSGKFLTGYQRLLVTLWQILQRVLTNFANSTYLPEGCQNSLILGQRVLITLQSNCQRVLDNVRYHCGGWSEEVNSCILIISYSTWFIYNLNTV